MSLYTDCKSGLIQRGEELFPIAHMGQARDYFKIQYSMEQIPLNGERLMGQDEVLELYD